MSDNPRNPSRLGACVALLLLLALVAGGFWLANHLTQISRTEDCLMAGRRNCAPIERGSVPPG